MRIRLNSGTRLGRVRMAIRTGWWTGVRVFVVGMLFASPQLAIALCGDGAVDVGEACDDGNTLAGDCCSPTCALEESLLGCQGLCLCDTCEDGFDNDSDGLFDAEDPECATLNQLQRQAVLGTAMIKRSSRTGTETMVTSVQGSVPGFGADGTCNLGDFMCDCPADAPDCEPLNRACNVNVDCLSDPYPLGPSRAGTCGRNVVLKKLGVFDGSVAATGSTRFGRFAVNIGGNYVNGGGTEEVDGEEPFVGPGQCFGSAPTCVWDGQCTPPDPETCLNRRLLNDPLNTHVDRTGAHPDYVRCVTGLAAVPVDSAAVALLPGAALPAINLRAKYGPFTLPLGGGAQIRVIPSVVMSRNTELILAGQPDTVVVLRIPGKMRMGGKSKITLTGGLTPEHVLWNLEGDTSGGDNRAAVAIKRDSFFKGTLLAPQRSKMVRVGGFVHWDGAIMGQRVDIAGDSVIGHRPFLPLLPTHLSVTKVDAPDPVLAGTPLTYTLTVINAGPSYAPGVVVTDTLPAGVTFTSAIPTQGTCDTSALPIIKCYLGTMGRATNAMITVTVLVGAGTRGTLTNTATVAANVGEASPADNVALPTTTVAEDAELTITKVDVPDPVEENVPGALTYTIQVQNTGSFSNALNVVVNDTLPGALTGVSVVPSQGGCVGFPCSLGTIPPGGIATITVTATVANGTAMIGYLGELSNTATASSPDIPYGTPPATATTDVWGNQGDACGAPADCATGNCVDGFCCNTACTGTCQACSAAKTGAANGTCADVTTNTDPDNDCALCQVCNAGACVNAANGTDPANDCAIQPVCAQDGQCNGSGACRLWVAGTLCASDGNVCTDDECDGAGTCAHPNNSDPCDDGNACTVVDLCSAGTCAGTAATCASPPNPVDCPVGCNGSCGGPDLCAP